MLTTLSPVTKTNADRSTVEEHGFSRALETQKDLERALARARPFVTTLTFLKLSESTL
jgi:hypothetical protein